MDSLGNVEAREYVFYYAQLKWHNHVRAACEAGLQRKGSDTQLQFWHQFAACMLGNYNEAINELERMRGKRDLEFPVTALLIFAHKSAKLVDYEQVLSAPVRRAPLATVCALPVAVCCCATPRP